MSKYYTPDQAQTKLLNELYRLQNKTDVKKKTIILYDLYTDRETNKLSLHNMHTCAKVILNNKIPVKIEKQEVQEIIQYKYVIPEDFKPEVKLIERVFEVEEPCEDGPSLDNIWIYENQNDVRVVVIPIQEDLIDISALREEAEKDDEEDKSEKAKIKAAGLQGLELKKAHAQWDAIKKQSFDKRCVVAGDKHLKMFKIEAFLATLLQKTEKVSICSLLEFSRHDQLAGFQKEFGKLFNAPNDFKPQYAVHRYNPKSKPKAAKEAQKEEVTTIFSTQNSQFSLKKCDILDDKYFFSTENIRTKIYENMQKNENKAIIFVIQDFVNNWSRISVGTALSFASVVQQITTVMNLSKAKDDPNASIQVNSSKDIINTTFDEVFKLYMLEQLWLPTKVKLQKFYTKERLNNIKVQKGEALIPSTIEHLIFCHFYSKISRDFLQKYQKADLQSKSDQIKLLSVLKSSLKEIYELIQEVNKTFLCKESNEEYRCKDMQKFFNFLIFSIESLQKLKKITKRDLATASELKTSFQSLRIKKQKILQYVIAYQSKILADQPIHYYDLYLLIINQNITKDIEKDMDYIYLHIHELKAYCIASTYMCNNQKLVQAIKSYALIGLKFKSLTQNKRKEIDIVKIQNRLARLLKIVGQQELAAKIYIKKRELELAHKCFSQVLMLKLKGSGDSKAEKLLEWGSLFEDQFQFDLSLSYYRKAFSYAKRADLKQKAIKCKLECNKHMRREPTEEELRIHLNFTQMEEPDMLNYTGKLELESMFMQLRKSLHWDKQAQCSLILEGEEDDKDADKSFFQKFEEDKLKGGKSQIME